MKANDLWGDINTMFRILLVNLNSYFRRKVVKIALSVSLKGFVA